jgi:acyl carrier protein
MDTLDTIRRLAADTLNVAEGPLLRATTLNEAGIDSLAAIDLVFAIEAHFGITIAAEDLGRVRSLRDLAVVADRLSTRDACHHDA